MLTTHKVWLLLLRFHRYTLLSKIHEIDIYEHIHSLTVTKLYMEYILYIDSHSHLISLTIPFFLSVSLSLFLFLCFSPSVSLPFSLCLSPFLSFSLYPLSLSPSLSPIPLCMNIIFHYFSVHWSKCSPPKSVLFCLPCMFIYVYVCLFRLIYYYFLSLEACHLCFYYVYHKDRIIL